MERDSREPGGLPRLRDPAGDAAFDGANPVAGPDADSFAHADTNPESYADSDTFADADTDTDGDANAHDVAFAHADQNAFANANSVAFTFTFAIADAFGYGYGHGELERESHRGDIGDGQATDEAGAYSSAARRTIGVAIAGHIRRGIGGIFPRKGGE